MNYFITAIGTDSGKTLVSAIITEMLQGDYWKPVQAGFPRDIETVQSLVSNAKTVFHKETFLLNVSASPHYAASVHGVHVATKYFELPTENTLVIEGAGGILVPLNDKEVVIDLAEKFKSEIVLVSNLYLGSINHTLLSVNELQRRNLPVKGIIFNGEPNKSSERIILSKSGLKCLLKIPQLEKIDKEVVRKLANELKENW
jgi:dethiobiotin synthetase